VKRVFMSHGGADPETVNPVADHLADLGYRVLGREQPGQEEMFVGSALQRVEAADVTVVLVTAVVSDIMVAEIAHTIRKDKGLLAVRRDPAVPIPDALYAAGAEVLDWTDAEDVEYLPRALAAAERGARVLAAAVTRGSGSGAPCARPTP
jgi:hypothetical protein